jgi:type IV pilus assembly protein PilC
MAVATEEKFALGELESQLKGQAKTRKLSNLRVKQADLIGFATQLSVMIESGVVLSEALDSLAEQAQIGPFKTVMSDITKMVKSGENLSKALAVYPKVFDLMFVSMVKASEASGRMSEMLGVLSGYLEFEAETKKKVKSALTYPAIMGIMAVVAITVMMFFVLPRFTKIYSTRNVALPALTQILVNFSNFISVPRNMIMVLGSIIGFVVGTFYWLRTPSGKQAADVMKIHLPLLKTMVSDLVVTRSMRIMATMLNTGVSLLDSLGVVKGATSNCCYRELWEKTDRHIRDGYQLSEAIKASQKTDLIPMGIVSMLKAGEKSGKIGMVCDKVSSYYEKKLQLTIKTLTSLIEPIMIVFMGGFIGTIAIALLLPIFKISQVVSH